MAEFLAEAPDRRFVGAPDELGDSVLHCCIPAGFNPFGTILLSWVGDSKMKADTDQ
jgi:hypothetical protein